jgi:putative restriction endonuclease
MSSSDTYVDQFSNLRQDHSQNYPPAALGASPHKPLLLLAVLDRFAEGQIAENQIPLDPGLGDLFSDYWQMIMPRDHHPNIALPFYHLTSEGFWHLIPKEGNEDVVTSGRRLRSIRKLHKYTEGARLDDNLFTLLQNKKPREALRRTLVEGYFSDDVQSDFYEYGRVHEAAFHYSRTLLNNALSQNVGAFDEPEKPIRDRGFRRAIVDAYDHRCAISGIRILTADGLSAVDAAHIVPWSKSHNDDPRNGLALSKLCHWVFERGLLTVTSDYVVKLSPELTAKYNTPGPLATLEGRSLLLPEDNRLYPEQEYLEYHRSNCFRRSSGM